VRAARRSCPAHAANGGKRRQRGTACLPGGPQVWVLPLAGRVPVHAHALLGVVAGLALRAAAPRRGRRVPALRVRRVGAERRAERGRAARAAPRPPERRRIHTV
jgi:hypothetical protein